VPVAAILRLGERIRAERARQGLSLRGLARAVGLSPSLISQIETGRCQPSVRTLYAITTALGVPVEEVFGDGSTTTCPPGRAVPRGHGPPARIPRRAAPAGPGPPGHGRRPRAPVTRHGGRDVLELQAGVTWERLGHVPGAGADFLLVTYPPGSSSSPDGKLMRHPGTEYGYLLRGELTVTVAATTHRMTSGDAISFRSATPHSYRNDGRVPAVGVWFVAGAAGPSGAVGPDYRSVSLNAD
jgi:DNA-binding XRE family transcriptional regulator/quercetin dioxygenase-like cupin family protein